MASDDCVVMVKSGAKRVRITIDLNATDLDSDDEFEEWFLESTLKKLGIGKRTMWMHPMNRKREVDGEYVRLCIPLREYPDRFFKYYRMTIPTHDYILNAIKDDLMKYSNRPSICPGERLAVTLKYLSTGLSFEHIAQTFLMHHYTVGLIVDETCKAIFNRLKDEHLAVPSPEGFKRIAADYDMLWQFPNCIGSLDGKHVRIRRPPRSGSMFYNYKHFYSIVLQAVADARYRFVFIDVGSYGKQSDGGIFAASSLSSFVDNKDNFPPDPIVDGLNIRLPYAFLCDDAYPLKPNMLKPFSGGNLTKEQDIYNGRLSRARRCVECAFGIAANKWRILLKSIETQADYKPETIVKAICVLHNVVINREGVDNEILAAVERKVKLRDSKMQPVNAGRRYNHAPGTAAAIRNLWMQYFNSQVGSVSWQDRYIKVK